MQVWLPCVYWTALLHGRSMLSTYSSISEGHVGSFLQVEDLDFAIRKKDKDTALAKLASAKTALDTALASVL